MTQKKTLDSSLGELEKQIVVAVSSAKTLDAAYSLRAEYLGKDALVTQLLQSLRDISKEDKPAAGAAINKTKQFIESEIDRLIQLLLQKDALQKDESRDIDLSAPFHINNNKLTTLGVQGSIHPIQHEINRMLDIFRTMGFMPFEARELDTDYYVFDSVNMPKNHPARANWDTFRTEEQLIPTPHTSNMQVRIMRLLKTAPLRAVIYGRCARNEATDMVHGHTFYQIEGVYIDKGISVSNMIATLTAFVEAFFDRPITWKIQPAYFPFTEPSIEYMVKCVFCEGSGCSGCKHTGWLEVLGAGMIHPNVLREGGFDPAVYTGFAWGLGLDRMVIQRNKIKDIRALYGSDIRFLQSRL